jgi:hypothetical protein
MRGQSLKGCALRSPQGRSILQDPTVCLTSRRVHRAFHSSRGW